MSTTLTLLAIGVVGGLVYGLRRSNTRKNRLLSAAARREKHAQMNATIIQEHLGCCACHWYWQGIDTTVALESG